MNLLAIAVAGATVALLATWVIHIALGRAAGEVRLSTDEKLSLERTLQMSEAFAEAELPPMGRLEVWRRITVIWKSVRAAVLHSGRWAGLPWLFLLGVLSPLITLKTLISPDSHDLRILLAGREFIDFFLAGRRSRRSRVPQASKRP